MMAIRLTLKSIVPNDTVIYGGYHIRTAISTISAFIGEQTKKEITTSVFRIVLAGGRYFSPEVIGGRQSYYVRGSTSRFLVSTDDRTALSNRQFDVLKLLAEGQPNKLIARELNIATGTVKVHISGILKALKAKNRTQAVSIAKHIKLL